MAADEQRGELDRLLHSGVPFAQLEDWIDGLRLSEEAKAGLWLLAWAEQERSTQRRIAEQALEAVAR